MQIDTGYLILHIARPERTCRLNVDFRSVIPESMTPVPIPAFAPLRAGTAA
jgi:hypothetical protein